MGSCSDTDIGPYCPDTNIGPSLEQYRYLGDTDIGPNPFLNAFAFAFVHELGLPEMLISLRIKLFLSSKAWFHRSRRRHTILTCDGRRDPLQNAEFYRATVSYEEEPFISFFPE